MECLECVFQRNLQKIPVKRTPRNKAWDAFSILVRVMASDNDGNVSCYTCNRRMYWKGEGAQAGHFNQGRGNADLFDLTQVRVQCYACNVGRYGEQFKFGERLRKEIGEKEFQKVLKRRHKIKPISKKEFEQLEQEFKEKTLKLIQYKNFEL